MDGGHWVKPWILAGPFGLLLDFLGVVALYVGTKEIPMGERWYQEDPNEPRHVRRRRWVRGGFVLLALGFLLQMVGALASVVMSGSP